MAKPSLRFRPTCESLEERTLLTIDLTPVPVNTHVDGNQWRPATASNAAGMTVVAWSDDDDGPKTLVKAQLFDAAGDPVGSEIDVVEISFRGDPFLSVVMDAAGNFVVAHDGVPFGFTMVSAAGIPQKTVTVEADGFYPEIAMDAVGNFVLTSLMYKGLKPSVHAWRYDAEGTLQQEYKVGKKGIECDVAMNAAGQFAVTYAKGKNIFVRRSDVNNKLLKAQKIARAPDEFLARPSIDLDDAGNILVAMTSLAGIVSQRISPTKVVSTVFPIDDTLIRDGSFPRVAMDHVNGDFIVIFTMASGIRVMEFEADGQLRAEFDLAPTRPDRQTGAGLCLNADGSYTVVYDSEAAGPSDGSYVGIFAHFGQLA